LDEKYRNQGLGHGEAGEVLLRLSKYRLLRGCWKMSICKLSFAKSRGITAKGRYLREAYIEVRRSDEG
jgi:hypothetical protein